MNPDRGLTADELAELPEVAESEPETALGRLPAPGQRVLEALHDLAESGVLTSGLQLTAVLRPRGPRNAKIEYEALCRLERSLLDELAERAPDAEEGDWQDLSLRRLNQCLLDQGHRSNPAVLSRLLRSLAEDGKGRAGQAGGFDLVYRSRRRYGVRLNRSWLELRHRAALRRTLGSTILAYLRAKALQASPGSGKRWVEFGLEELTEAVRNDLALRGQGELQGSRATLEAVERGLLFLHEHRVLQLQNGLAVFRQALTIKILPEAKGRRYTRKDYRSLSKHHGERIFQVHVMARYAGLGLESAQQAWRLVKDYFSGAQEHLIKQYFEQNRAALARATSPESYDRIVESLKNQQQEALVSAPSTRNLLVLAGPGSGKTRVVVHRCAFLLRVERVPASRILVLCFNRNAAIELRLRLRRLVGDDARGVTVQTYHGMAMRLTGTSFGALGGEQSRDFDEILRAAIRLLDDGGDLPGVDAEELRESLVAGYSHILVDEYQDINRDQYELVSALAGRRDGDPDRKLTMMAVGDDDQNIYGWNGTSIEFIRRFREDYPAEVCYLVECYRSTVHILACAHRVIEGGRDRMKVDHPVRVDAARATEPAGGRWHDLEPSTGGRVLVMETDDAATQATEITARLQQMRQLDPGWRWRDVAVLARRHADLDPIRAALEAAGVPAAWSLPSAVLPPLHRLREMAVFLRSLEARRGRRCSISQLEKLLARLLAQEVAHPWRALLVELLEELRAEAGEDVTTDVALEFLYEGLAEKGREPALGDGVRLATVHAAKGAEYRHVFLADGGWRSRGIEADEEERRLYYVGMTRARETLHLGKRADCKNPYLRSLRGEFVDRLGTTGAKPSPGGTLASVYSFGFVGPLPELCGLSPEHGFRPSAFVGAEPRGSRDFPSSGPACGGRGLPWRGCRHAFGGLWAPLDGAARHRGGGSSPGFGRAPGRGFPGEVS